MLAEWVVGNKSLIWNNDTALSQSGQRWSSGHTKGDNQVGKLLIIDDFADFDDFCRCHLLGEFFFRRRKKNSLAKSKISPAKTWFYVVKMYFSPAKFNFSSAKFFFRRRKKIRRADGIGIRIEKQPRGKFASSLLFCPLLIKETMCRFSCFNLTNFNSIFFNFNIFFPVIRRQRRHTCNTRRNCQPTKRQKQVFVTRFSLP